MGNLVCAWKRGYSGLGQDACQVCNKSLKGVFVKYCCGTCLQFMCGPCYSDFVFPAAEAVTSTPCKACRVLTDKRAECKKKFGEMLATGDVFSKPTKGTFSSLLSSSKDVLVTCNLGSSTLSWRTMEMSGNKPKDSGTVDLKKIEKVEVVGDTDTSLVINLVGPPSTSTSILDSAVGNTSSDFEIHAKSVKQRVAWHQALSDAVLLFACSIRPTNLDPSAGTKMSAADERTLRLEKERRRDKSKARLEESERRAAEAKKKYNVGMKYTAAAMIRQS